MSGVFIHLVQQSEAWVGSCIRLDYNRCLFVRTVFILHRMEDIISLFDEILYHLWTEAERCQLLDSLVNQFLELWRVESGSGGGRRKPKLAWR